MIYIDAFDMFKNIADCSVECVFTDPPYFLDQMGSDNWLSKGINPNSHLKQLPIGMKFKPESGVDFQTFMEKVSKEAFRILKPGGFFMCFSSPRLYHRLAISAENQGFEIRDMFAWCYKVSQVKSFSMTHIIEKDPNIDSSLTEELKNHKTPVPKTAYEPILFAVKPKEGRYIDNYIKYGVGLMDTSVKSGINNDKYPTNLITTEEINQEFDKLFLVSRDKKTELNTHPTVKPVSLCEHLIRLFTKENDTVVDPFLGSGTTAVACEKSKRKWIGAESNEAYRSIIETRLTKLN